MNHPLSVPALAALAWQDFRRTWGKLIVYEALFKLFTAWLFAPAVALTLASILSRAGHVAVSNRDLLTFVLSPHGLLYAGLLGTGAFALLLFEQGGILAIVAWAESFPRPPAWRSLLAALPTAWRVAQLSALGVGLLTLTAAPFVGLAALTGRALLGQHDIYFYINERPPVFWLAAGIGALLLLAAAAATTWLYVRYSLALPIVVFERAPALAALRASRQRVRGAGLRVGLVLVGWLLAALAAGAGLSAAIRLTAGAVLAGAGELPMARILALLIAQAGLLAGLSFVTVVGLALLTRRIYLIRGGPAGLAERTPDESPAAEGPRPAPWPRRLAYLFIAAMLAAPVAAWADLSRQLDHPLPRVTAHRGHARAAPENTLSAVRKALASGADYVEVDAALTADGVVVLLHDRDLKRVAGDSRPLENVTYAEVRQLDVGSWFAPAFAGERVPTLDEVVELCRGRARLNIELKTFGADRGLAGAVARIVRERRFEDECVVTAFGYDVLQEARRHNPRLRTGLIVAHAVGDLSRLDVEVLSVRADHLSDQLLHDARRRGREVHVWTVNDARLMTRMMKRGVDNLITSDPDLAIQTRAEWASLTAPERLLLAAQLFLGVGP